LKFGYGYANLKDQISLGKKGKVIEEGEQSERLEESGKKRLKR
jgi:hypothetical protein